MKAKYGLPTDVQYYDFEKPSRESRSSGYLTFYHQAADTYDGASPGWTLAGAAVIPHNSMVLDKKSVVNPFHSIELNEIGFESVLL